MPSNVEIVTPCATNGSSPPIRTAGTYAEMAVGSAPNKTAMAKNTPVTPSARGVDGDDDDRQRNQFHDRKITDEYSVLADIGKRQRRAYAQQPACE